MLATGPRAARGGGGGAAAPPTGAAEATVSSATSSTLAAAASTSTVRILVSILRAFLCVRHGLLAIAIQISHLMSYRIVSFVVVARATAVFRQQRQEKRENFCTTRTSRNALSVSTRRPGSDGIASPVSTIWTN